jgi:RecB family exonuclease
MALTVVATPYGAPASVALRDELARLKGGDPLAPVTVVVPTNSVGVAARRLLASGELGAIAGDRAGLAGVNFLTVFRLAELLAAPLLAHSGRRPVSTPVVAAAVRGVLAREPGLFAPVAEHPATEEALVGAHRELSDLDDAALGVLASRSLRAREVVRVHRAARAALAPAWYDEHDLMRVACEVLAGDAPLARELGPVVCQLPQRWSRPEARVISTLATGREVVVVVGLTGIDAADASVVASVERAGGKVPDAARAAITPARGTHVVSTSDPDDEVRHVVRGVVTAMRDGVHAERIAVLYENTEPYARLLHEHFALADIPHNGTSVRTLADSVLGSSLLRLLALGDDDFRRDHVFALLAAAPVLNGGRRVPATDWERVSRKAGVVGGRDEWQQRLTLYAAGLGDGEGDRRRHAHAVALQEFVDGVATDLDRGRDLRSWAALARWAQELVRRWLGDEARRERDGWPAFELEAARRVDASLERLGGLDRVEPDPSFEVFRRTVELELRAARDRVGHLGEGVLVGSVGLALGVEFDRVFVCGLAEGVFPAPPREDPLLGDTERAALDGELRLRRDRVHDHHRELLAAFASTSGPRVCCIPRGELRRSTEHVPSRFALASLAAMGGAPESIPSFVHGVMHAEFPATYHELAVQAACAGAPWVGTIPAVALGRELTEARASQAFTRFDGNLVAVADRLGARSPLHEGVAVSASRLQQWALCPHAYFMSYVLNVEPVERPEEIQQISALDRGSLIHAALDRFLVELRGRDDVGRPWTAADRRRLREIAEEEAAAVEARGLVGRRLLWERDREIIFSHLDAFLTADELYRAEHGARTLATELSFGTRADATHPALELLLSDGRALRVTGAIDRIDQRADGSLFVIDYKTGSDRDYRKLSPADPILGGTHLQLPIYAAAARMCFPDATAAPVGASYWFVGRGDNRRIGYEVDDAVVAEFDRAVRAIVDGIDAGCFVAIPPTPGPQFWTKCAFCDPDRRGTSERWRETARKFAAPDVAPYRRLVGDEVPS